MAILKPSSNSASATASPRSVSLDTARGEQSVAARLVQTYDDDDDLEMTITNTTSGETIADYTDVVILPGAGTATKTLRSNVTCSSGFPDFASLMDYADKTPMAVTSLRIQTNNPENFSGKLIIRKFKTNGKAKDIVIDFTKYRTTGASGTDDTINIDNKEFQITPGTTLILKKLKGASYITLKFRIPMVGETVEFFPQ